MKGGVYHLPKKTFNLPSDQHFEIIFITSKLYDTGDILHHITENNLTYDTIVVIQNGLVFDDFYDEIDKDKIVTVSVYEGHHLQNNTVSISSSHK